MMGINYFLYICAVFRAKNEKTLDFCFGFMLLFDRL